MTQLPAKAVIVLIRVYQYCVSPLLPSMCRFTPTCSRYAVEALQRHGIARGLALAVWRVLRCQPFSRGGYDPVPDCRRQPATSAEQQSDMTT
jgi:hypothetical protein